MNRDELSTTIWRIADTLRGMIYARDLAFSTTRLLFLKYALDNNIGVSTMEDMKICSRAQKIFAMLDVESGIDTVFKVLQYIDKAYQFDGLLAKSAQDYARELFGIDPTISKRSATTEGFKNLLAVLGQLDLEEHNEDHETGRMLVDCLSDMIMRDANGRSNTAEATSRKSLNMLAKALLAVEEKDIFLDYASGVGLSTLAITQDVLPSIYNVESNVSIAPLSAMLYIMYGYPDIHVINGDGIITALPSLHGNKIFVDGPINVKITAAADPRYKDISRAIIDRAIHSYLVKNGTAVITVASNTLFNDSKPAVELRKEMISLGVLKAVIALPPLWNGTSIGTNLLVIQKQSEPIKNVVFINVMDAVKISGRYTSKTNVELPDDLIAKIVAVVNEPQTIEGFSFVATEDDIAAKGFNFSPAGFVILPRKEDTISLAEIDSQLDSLYKELQNLQ